MKIISETEKGWETLWNLKSSDSDGRWVLGQVNITGRSILIVAEKEDGESSGYAAVDDFIEVEDVGKCDVLPEAAAPTPASKYPDCDFETDYCGWTRGDDVDNTTDRFALVRQKGVDIIGDTGPSHDHLFKNSSIFTIIIMFLFLSVVAYFLWSNADFGQQNDIAAISSPSVNLLETLCFNFWFDLTHNDGIEEVVIYIESNKDLTRIPIWEYKHSLFDEWERGRVEIPKYEDYKVRMILS